VRIVASVSRERGSRPGRPLLALGDRVIVTLTRETCLVERRPEVHLARVEGVVHPSIIPIRGPNCGSGARSLRQERTP
jgi:hypothetical protein